MIGDHQHGHENDRGVSGALRYLRWLPQMWRSPVNDEVVDAIAPQAGERVVDIGAGMGAGTMRAASTGATVVAVDPTPFMRRMLTARRLVSRSRQRVEIVDGAAEHLPVDDGTVDAVWAVNTMHHWTDQAQGASEILRVLRPGGRVRLVDEDFTDPAHPDHERFGSDAGGSDDHDDHDDGHDGHEPGHHHGFTMVDARAMGELFGDAGFTDVEAAQSELAGRPVISVSATAPA